MLAVAENIGMDKKKAECIAEQVRECVEHRLGKYLRQNK